MIGEKISYRICPRCKDWKDKESKRPLLISSMIDSIAGTCYTRGCNYWFMKSLKSQS